VKPDFLGDAYAQLKAALASVRGLTHSSFTQAKADALAEELSGALCNLGAHIQLCDAPELRSPDVLHDEIDEDPADDYETA
jgi:hypothetical protein